MKINIESWKRIAFSSITFVLMLLSIARYTFALSDPPTFSELEPIINRIVNVLMMSAGLVLVAMIAYGVWKSSLATGDPRGLEGAKSTWTYAIYGFFIVVGSLAIVMIVEGILGFSSGGGFIHNLIVNIDALMTIPSSN